MCFYCQPKSIGKSSPQPAILQVTWQSDLGSLPKMVLGFNLLFVSIKLVFHKVNLVCTVRTFKNLDFSFAFPGVKKVWWVRKQLSSLPMCRQVLNRQVTNPFVLFHKHILNEFPKLMVQLCNGWHISRISWTRSQPGDFWSFQNHSSIILGIDLCAL